MGISRWAIGTPKASTKEVQEIAAALGGQFVVWQLLYCLLPHAARFDHIATVPNAEGPLSGKEA